MPAPADTTLSTRLKISIITNYRRTDLELNPLNARDGLRISEAQSWQNGSGSLRADLQWHDQRSLSGSENLDLDGVLTNAWGMTLDYNTVKMIFIRNNETDESKYIDVTFKKERYIIGAGGSRMLIEPNVVGARSISSSSSSEEGYISVTARGGTISYDIIVIGASAQASSSGG
jgi:hypothetical protein